MMTSVAKKQTSVERGKIIAQLHEAVKQCQIRFGGKKELATEIDKRVSSLCTAWENIFQHGLRCNHNNKALATLKQLTQVTGLNKIKINAIDDIRNLEADPTFWSFVKEHLSRHELQRYMSLKFINTDNGRSSAWLRSALNEHSLEKYIHMMIGSPDILSQYYEDWALLRDEEKSSLLPNMAAGLGSILFAIIIDNAVLNTERSSSSSTFHLQTDSQQTVHFEDDAVLQPTIMKTVAPVESKREKKRKKKPANIVTFDHEEFSSCSASPASCLVSPQEKVVENSSLARSKDNGSINHSKHVVDKSPLLSTQPVVNKSFIDDATDEETTSKPEISRHAFSFDGYELQTSAKSRLPFDPEKETGYDSTGLCSELNGFHSDGSNAKDLHAVETEEKENILGTGYLECDAEGRVMSLPQTSVVIDQSVHIRGETGDRSKVAVNLKSDKGTNRSLPHSDSVTSNTSMTSACSQSSNLMVCDVDSTMALVPLNADGKPVELDDATVGSFDGDTTSESYGSYDSQEMPYGEMVHRAMHALDEAEKALNSSISHYSSSRNNGASVPDYQNAVTDALSYEDLKQALIAMMLRKDEAEDLSRRLQVVLDAEKQTVVSLRKEIDDKHQAELQRQEKSAERIRALMRENDLLKNQLKKYVGAVQMLRQGGTVEDFPGINMETPQPAIPPPRSAIDYSFEAEEYEKKLIQVAEMHGELMEFNELLQRQLVIREAQLRHITGELVSLRGPLPVEIAPQESEVIASSSNANSASISTSPLINIWIPSAFLKGSSSDAYHVYQVYVHIRNEEWNIYRRYAEFFELHCRLKKKYPAVSYFDFPPKKAFGKKDPKIVEIRRKKLETYLRQVIHHMTEKSRRLAESPSRQVLIDMLPFFSDEVKAENPKQRKKQSRNSSNLVSTLHPSTTSEVLNNVDHPQQYMGL